MKIQTQVCNSEVIGNTFTVNFRKKDRTGTEYEIIQFRDHQIRFHIL